MYAAANWGPWEKAVGSQSETAISTSSLDKDIDVGTFCRYAFPPSPPPSLDPPPLPPPPPPPSPSPPPPRHTYSTTAADDSSITPASALVGCMVWFGVCATIMARQCCQKRQMPPVSSSTGDGLALNTAQQVMARAHAGSQSTSAIPVGTPVNPQGPAVTVPVARLVPPHGAVPGPSDESVARMYELNEAAEQAAAHNAQEHVKPQSSVPVATPVSPQRSALDLPVATPVRPQGPEPTPGPSNEPVTSMTSMEELNDAAQQATAQEHVKVQDIVAKISALKQLLDDDAISSHDFETKKAELLARV